VLELWPLEKHRFCVILFVANYFFKLS